MNVYGYQLIGELGRGAYGTTYLATDNKGNKFAIKTINIYKTQKENLDVTDEVDVLKDLSRDGCYKYIACYYNNFIEKLNNIPTMFIVLEYVAGGSLKDLIVNNPGAIIPSYLWPIMFQLLLGLKFIHDRGYAHRDIKTENILLSENVTIKYIDFGFGCVESCKRLGCKNICKGTHGTLEYTPPEFFQGIKLDSLEASKAHDMWSLAVVLFRLCNDAVYPYENTFMITTDDLKGHIAVAPEFKSNYGADDGRTDVFVDSLLINDWTLRPTISVAVDRFIDNISTVVYNSTEINTYNFT